MHIGSAADILRSCPAPRICPELNAARPELPKVPWPRTCTRIEVIGRRRPPAHASRPKPYAADLSAVCADPGGAAAGLGAGPPNVLSSAAAVRPEGQRSNEHSGPTTRRGARTTDHGPGGRPGGPTARTRIAGVPRQDQGRAETAAVRADAAVARPDADVPRPGPGAAEDRRAAGDAQVPENLRPGPGRLRLLDAASVVPCGRQPAATAVLGVQQRRTADDPDPKPDDPLP